MPPVNPAPTKNGRVQALQRLAIQKGLLSAQCFCKPQDLLIWLHLHLDPLPLAVPNTAAQNPNPIYPKLPEISGDQARVAVTSMKGPHQG